MEVLSCLGTDWSSGIALTHTPFAFGSVLPLLPLQTWAIQLATVVFLCECGRPVRWPPISVRVTDWPWCAVAWSLRLVARVLCAPS